MAGQMAECPDSYEVVDAGVEAEEVKRGARGVAGVRGGEARIEGGGMIRRTDFRWEAGGWRSVPRCPNGAQKRTSHLAATYKPPPSLRVGVAGTVGWA